MAEWLRENIFITNSGNAAMVNASVGKSKIQITKVTTSSDTFKGDYPLTATDLTNKVQDFVSITWRKVANNSSAYLLQMQLSNRQGLNYPNPPENNYKLKQIGVFAKQVDTETEEVGEEFLLMYAQPSSGTEDTISFDTDTEIFMTYAIQLNLYSEIGDNVTITTNVENAGIATEKFVVDNIAVFQNYPEFTGEVGLKRSSWFSADLGGNIISYRKQYFNPAENSEITLYEASGLSAITFKTSLPTDGKYTVYVLSTNTPTISATGSSTISLQSAYSKSAPFTETGMIISGFSGEFSSGEYQFNLQNFGVFVTLCIVSGELNAPDYRWALPAFELGKSMGGETIADTFTISTGSIDDEFKVLFPMYYMGDTYALQSSFEDFKEEMKSKNHVGILYRNEELSEDNVIYFIVDEDKPTITEDANSFLYDNVVYSEQTPEQNEENWFKIVGEGGDEDVKPENVKPYSGILKVLEEEEVAESDADFINEIEDERS